MVPKSDFFAWKVHNFFTGWQPWGPVDTIYHNRHSSAVLSFILTFFSEDMVNRSYDSLKAMCQQANLCAPDRITSVAMRKYMATLTQVYIIVWFMFRIKIICRVFYWEHDPDKNEIRITGIIAALIQSIFINIAVNIYYSANSFRQVYKSLHVMAMLFVKICNIDASIYL